MSFLGTLTIQDRTVISALTSVIISMVNYDFLTNIWIYLFKREKEESYLRKLFENRRKEIEQNLCIIKYYFNIILWCFFLVLAIDNRFKIAENWSIIDKSILYTLSTTIISILVGCIINYTQKKYVKEIFHLK